MRAVPAEVVRIVARLGVLQELLDVGAVEHGAGREVVVFRIGATAECVLELGVATLTLARKIEPPQHAAAALGVPQIGRGRIRSRCSPTPSTTPRPVRPVALRKLDAAVSPSARLSSKRKGGDQLTPSSGRSLARRRGPAAPSSSTPRVEPVSVVPMRTKRGGAAAPAGTSTMVLARSPTTRGRAGPRQRPEVDRRARDGGRAEHDRCAAQGEREQGTVRNHPELKDSQIMRLVGTTKSTIQAIRERTHWNSTNLTPLDPVTLGLCSQIDLDLEVQRAAKEKPAPVEAHGATLLPASVTTAPKEEPASPRRKRNPTSSTSRPCSPSSSSSAARTSRFRHFGADALAVTRNPCHASKGRRELIGLRPALCASRNGNRRHPRPRPFRNTTQAPPAAMSLAHNFSR